MRHHQLARATLAVAAVFVVAYDMLTQPRIALGILVGAALGLGGCGYSFRGTLPSHIRTIAVPIFGRLSTRSCMAGRAGTVKPSSPASRVRR